MKNFIKISSDKKEALESELQAQGFKPLTPQEIKAQVIGKVFLGSYPPAFKYVIAINRNGTLEGKNDYGHYDIGTWALDKRTGAFTVRWQYGWDASTVYIYQVDGEFMLMDSITGSLRTVLHQTIKPPSHIRNYRL